VFNTYAKAYNKRYGHTGTLFEGNDRVKPVEVERVLLHLCRYIHANPVIHGLVDYVAGWPYSNDSEWVGEREGTWVDAEFVQAHFPATGQVRAFVAEWIADRRLPDALAMYLRTWDG
jgi:hypothetical protein